MGQKARGDDALGDNLERHGRGFHRRPVILHAFAGPAGVFGPDVADGRPSWGHSMPENSGGVRRGSFDGYRTMNRPWILVFEQMWVKPRKSKISVLPSPRLLRLSAEEVFPATEDKLRRYPGF